MHYEEALKHFPVEFKYLFDKYAPKKQMSGNKVLNENGPLDHMHPALNSSLDERNIFDVSNLSRPDMPTVPVTEMRMPEDSMSNPSAILNEQQVPGHRYRGDERQLSVAIEFVTIPNGNETDIN